MEMTNVQVTKRANDIQISKWRKSLKFHYEKKVSSRVARSSPMKCYKNIQRQESGNNTNYQMTKYSEKFHK